VKPSPFARLADGREFVRPWLFRATGRAGGRRAGVKRFVVALVGLVLLSFVRPVGADEVAPGLEGSDLRVRADLLLRALVAAKPEPKLRGIYAAFDANDSDPSAQVACDDDGDYVIVLSDAMLRLASFVARVAKEDEKNGTHEVDDYAAFLVRNQAAGKRLLPPAAGAFASGGVDPMNEDRWNAIVLFVYASELAHLRAGDLVCANPTVTKERGDAQWTAAERTAATATAKTIYPGKPLERDAAAIAELHALAQDDRGALTLLQFFARFEAESLVTPPRAMPRYLMLHPRSASRVAALKNATP
jgi:hypothetical protein